MEMITVNHIGALTTAGEGGAAGSLLLMTLASVGLLCFLPATVRRQLSQVGTYVHEVSHGVVSLLTGGEFRRFHVSNSGGLCITSGGSRKAVAAAGYVGTLVLGAVFLARSAQPGTLVIPLQVVAVLLALSTLKAGDVHTAAVGAVAAALLGLLTTLLPGATATRFLLNLVGVILVWQGLRAIWILCTVSARRKGTPSDAETLAQLTGHSALYWAVVFGGIALAICSLVLFLAVGGATAPS